MRYLLDNRAAAALTLIGLYFFFNNLIWPPLSRWLSGRAGERHSLYSEIHGLLEVSIKQTAAMVEVRDLLRARPILDMSPITGAIHSDIERISRVVHDLSVSILESRPTDEQHKSNAAYLARALSNSDKCVALLGQMRDAQAVLPEWMQIAHNDSAKQLDTLKRIEALQDFTVIQKQGADQIAALDRISTQAALALKQLESNDHRLAEFVNATKGIMRAINGGGQEDEDLLVEDAKMIRMRAAEKGIEVSFEDAYARAKNQRVYNRG